MTYPPIPPPGPDGPWQAQPPQYPPLGPPQGPPSYGPPQQPYGPTPYGPTPYGPPPYGAPQGPPQQQPYGYGGPPPGYPYFQQHPQQPPSGGNRKWLILGAVAVVAVFVIVGLVAMVAISSDGGDEPMAAATLTDEDQIEQLFYEITGIESNDIQGALPYFCEEDLEVLEAFGDLDPMDLPVEDPDPAATISDIDVTGDEASAQVDNYAGSATIYFRKESGDWKFCMSAMPGLPSMPR